MTCFSRFAFTATFLSTIALANGSKPPEGTKLSLTEKKAIAFSHGRQGDPQETIAMGDDRAASFEVKGHPFDEISVEIENEAIELRHRFQNDTLLASNFTYPQTIKLNKKGVGAFRVGGSLSALPFNNASGLYYADNQIRVRSNKQGTHASNRLYLFKSVGSEIAIANVKELSFGKHRLGERSISIGAKDKEAAVLSVSGDPHASYSISLPSYTYITLIRGDQLLKLTDFVSSPEIGSLDASGEQDFSVGATAHITGDLLPGCYVGTGSVAVEYLSKVRSFAYEHFDASICLEK